MTEFVLYTYSEAYRIIYNKNEGFPGLTISNKNGMTFFCIDA
jgi:hypothetical protein